MRKLLSVITAAACILLYPAAAFADTENSVGAELVQTFEAADPAVVLNVVPVEEGSSEAMVSVLDEYKETLTEIVIPETIKGYKIVGIDNKGFENCKKLVSVTLPDTINSLYPYSFSGCEILNSINIPESVTEIGEYAFSACSLSTVALPENLKSIGAAAFRHNYALNNVVIPEGITEIKKETFYCCINLTDITLPSKLEKIGDNAFYAIACSNPAIIPDTVKTIGKGAFAYCNFFTTIIIPDSVRSIGDEAFRYCKRLKSMTIPGTVEKLGIGLFTEAQIETVTFEDGVTMIPDYCFYDCKNLETVNIPGSVKTIGEEAFRICESLKSIIIPKSVKSIEWGAFEMCTALTSITIPGSVERLDIEAFQDCDLLETIIIENGALTTIPESCFNNPANAKIRTVYIPLNIKTIEKYAFGSTNKYSDVYFEGTKAQWEQVQVNAEGNKTFLNATFHYLTPAPGEPELVYIPLAIPKQGKYPVITGLKAVALNDSSGVLTELAVDEENGIDITYLESGSYTIRVGADQCPERSYSFIASYSGISGEAAGGVELHLYGDADGDGRIYYYDIMIANAHAKGKSILTGYDLAVCDVNQDGKVNIQDVAKINGAWNGKYSLWN